MPGVTVEMMSVSVLSGVSRTLSVYSAPALIRGVICMAAWPFCGQRMNSTAAICVSLNIVAERLCVASMEIPF